MPQRTAAILALHGLVVEVHCLPALTWRKSRIDDLPTAPAPLASCPRTRPHEEEPMAEASWLADPTGVHELRYWNGSSWTEHVSDQGEDDEAGARPPTVEPPLRQPTRSRRRPAPPPAAAAPAGGKPSWKDRLKQVADQGKAIADQGKQKLAEQNAKRTEQWANDPNTLWFGESKNAATSAAGVSKARYRITKDRVWIESGCSAPAPRACRCGRSRTWTCGSPSGSRARTSVTSSSTWRIRPTEPTRTCST